MYQSDGSNGYSMLFLDFEHLEKHHETPKHTPQFLLLPFLSTMKIGLFIFLVANRLCILTSMEV